MQTCKHLSRYRNVPPLDTFITEFVPVQEEVCEENFWKACKITFKEQAYNYTLETCTTPLVKRCEEQQGQQQQQYQQQQETYGAPAQEEPETVCKIWFESECNTTFSEVGRKAGDFVERSPLARIADPGRERGEAADVVRQNSTADLCAGELPRGARRARVPRNRAGIDGEKAGGGVRPAAHETVPPGHQPGAAPRGAGRLQGDTQGSLPPAAR